MVSHMSNDVEDAGDAPLSAFLEVDRALEVEIGNLQDLQGRIEAAITEDDLRELSAGDRDALLEGLTSVFAEDVGETGPVLVEDKEDIEDA